jgi:uncharacterized membrane protein HdeD (DUF308 family)
VSGMEVIERRFKKFQLFSMIVSVFSFVIGLIFLGFEKRLMVEIYKPVIGSIVVISGLFSLVKYFYDGLANDVYKFEIVNGLGMLIIGVFMLFADFDDILGTIGILFGIYYLLSSLAKGYYTYRFFKENEEIFPLYLMITLLFVVMGVLSIINPFKSFMIVTRLISIFLVVGSVFELMSASLFKRRSKNILKIFE